MYALLPVLVAVQGLPAAPDSASAPDPTTVEREVWVMGTRLRVLVQSEPGGTAGDAERAAEAVVTEVVRLDRLLTTWDPGSSMAGVNGAPVGRPVTPEPELARYLLEVEAWARRTDRAFDPSVGALIDAWGLREGGRTPAAAELASARNAVGPGALLVDPVRGMVTRHAPLAWIDTGGFGKGVAVRAAASRLAELGTRRALIDLGGQLWAEAPPEEPWPVAVAHPGSRDEPAGRLALHGVSVATSGLSERPGHILDPRTGRPVPPWGSVTVVSRDPVEADVLATALYVMGPAAGMAWARAHPPVAVLFLEEREDRLVPTWSPPMERWIEDLKWSSTVPISREP